ncbi:MAG: helix-turn-helix domain-containing protein [Bacteroidales bacterium]|jgi:transcriptional regulator with XRE-family HTH domain|nr:helix-turn-helix domain-containing protein [Bacteroidales bacterium]
MKERIEKILKDKRLSQAEFADRIGVNRSSITHLMTGRNKSSETVLARTLLEFPDINPLWLSEGEGEVYKSVVNSPNTTGNDTSIKEEDTLEKENFLTPYMPYPVDEGTQTTKIQQPAASPESYVLPLVNEPEISHPQQNVEKEKEKQKEEKKHETKSPNKNEKQIRKIVFFYDDKTFEEYYPEKTQ